MAGTWSPDTCGATNRYRYHVSIKTSRKHTRCVVGPGRVDSSQHKHKVTRPGQKQQNTGQRTEVCVPWGYPGRGILQAYLTLLQFTKVFRQIQVSRQVHLEAKGSLKISQKMGQPVLPLDCLWTLDSQKVHLLRNNLPSVFFQPFKHIKTYLKM